MEGRVALRNDEKARSEQRTFQAAKKLLVQKPCIRTIAAGSLLAFASRGSVGRCLTHQGRNAKKRKNLEEKAIYTGEKARVTRGHLSLEACGLEGTGRARVIFCDSESDRRAASKQEGIVEGDVNGRDGCCDAPQRRRTNGG